MKSKLPASIKIGFLSLTFATATGIGITGISPTPASANGERSKVQVTTIQLISETTANPSITRFVDGKRVCYLTDRGGISCAKSGS
ncbi:MAG: hypothetical protein LW865_16190 [Betaproteobacteria bacterium]|jgi:hypothetical protein|nr:hypothetical protein [Rhodocyclaceae bacterium]MCE2724795.1 hypothetical protein [Betaproteobacteria bacterium]